ncbi:MAG: UvrD-helicase domain-containing protein, partial [Bacteroidota bacterium]
MGIQIISAGAGSGKTYRLTSEMVRLLKEGVRASGIIATTFTQKAAAELQERVRTRLLEEGLTAQADALTNALIGTVHGLGVKLLRRFAFEAGVSPQVAIIADEDQQTLFNNALSMVLTQHRVQQMEALCERLGLHKRQVFDWRNEVRRLTDVARANDFTIPVLEQSKVKSFQSFQQFLGATDEEPLASLQECLDTVLAETIEALEQNADSTKKTQGAIDTLKELKKELQLRGQLFWYQWVKLGKLSVGAKSKDDIIALQEVANLHLTQQGFHNDIQAFIDTLFDIVIAALAEYDRYKKQRGLIDYTDMEVLIKELLKNEAVREVLAEELDLLMVDEFQDTSPIQLEIFLTLSRLAKHSVWVGDPKQSIYGFRGADPSLMQAIIKQLGGVKPEDIQRHSWRSREDIVYATNALFTKAFDQLPADQVALLPKRKKLADAESINKESEPLEMEDALCHWHFEFDGEGRRLPGAPWMENCIANSLKAFLEGGVHILPKGEKSYRKATLGDVAILCRSNSSCQSMAEALHRAGLKAAIARAGLLSTAEAKIVLAGLKYLLNRQDSLSIAELLLLGAKESIEDIIADRLDFLKKIETQENWTYWADQQPIIHALDELRERALELTSSEILNVLLEELELRRIIVSWGRVEQRLDNIEVLRKMALQYEEACNRLHAASSLGGFLLWLNEQEAAGQDKQGSGEGPDAVNVLTYHRSKGLEWPIVVCHSLEGVLRADIWGMDIVAESEEVDLDNVLGNRWLRYWVNPYADQFRNTLLETRINESAAKALAKARALQEEARLLYVGITRARDYLVFPTRRKPTNWLNRVWHKGKGDFPTLDHDSNETPWEWQGQFLYKQTEVYHYPKLFTEAELQEDAINYFAASNGKKNYDSAAIDLKKEKLPGLARDVLQTLRYHATFPLHIDADKYTAAKLIKAFFTADDLHHPTEARHAMAEAFIERYQLPQSVDVADLLLHG